MLNDFDADIYLLSHLHDIKTLTSPRLILDNGNNIKARNRVGAITGSWFRSYEQGIVPSYAEQRGYSPTNIGCPIIKIMPDKGIIKVEG
jgi:hypothetical protein